MIFWPGERERICVHMGVCVCVYMQCTKMRYPFKKADLQSLGTIFFKSQGGAESNMFTR